MNNKKKKIPNLNNIHDQNRGSLSLKIALFTVCETNVMKHVQRNRETHSATTIGTSHMIVFVALRTPPPPYGTITAGVVKTIALMRWVVLALNRNTIKLLV